MSDVEFEVAGGVGTIRLNRPEKLNAFTLGMIDAWADGLEAFRDDPAVSVIVLTGAGRAFCAGGDVGAMDDRRDETAFERKAALDRRIHRIPRLLEDMDKPYIAAINGVAVGAGLDMALMADMRFAARSARMGETYIRMGLVPGDGGAWYLPRIVGLPKAMELFLTGELIDADEAERIGLVNRTLPDETLMEHVTGLARRLAALPPLSLRMMKRAVLQGTKTDLRTALDTVSSHFGVITTTRDQKEAVAAFAAKRMPAFRGE